MVKYVFCSYIHAPYFSDKYTTYYEIQQTIPNKHTCLHFIAMIEQIGCNCVPKQFSHKILKKLSKTSSCTAHQYLKKLLLQPTD